MTSFLKNLKSTFLDSPNSKKMPSRHTPNEDPFKRINNWDDGYEYIQGGDHTMSGAQGPMYSPPSPKPARRSTYEPDYARERYAYPSPPDSDGGNARGRDRRSAYRAPSPPKRRDSRRETADRYREDDGYRRPPPAQRRPNLDSHYTAPAVGRPSDLPRSYSRSPSPRAARRSDRRHNSYRDPSPPRKTREYRDSYPTDDYRDRRESSYRDSRHGGYAAQPPNAPRYRSPSPQPKKKNRDSNHYYPPRAGEKQARPTISRSKTTSSAPAAGGTPKLSPRWQKAAQAALQAGSVAAYQLRSQPGAWKGEKGAKVATAALGAAAIDAFLKRGDSSSNDDDRRRESDRDRDRDRDRGGGRDRKRSEVEILGDAVGGFLADQFGKRTGRH